MTTTPARSTSKGTNGTVKFDGTFVTIAQTGAFARMTIGKGEKRVPLASITSVQWKPPGAIVNGYIAFSVPGGNEKQSASAPRPATPARTKTR